LVCYKLPNYNSQSFPAIINRIYISSFTTLLLLKVILQVLDLLLLRTRGILTLPQHEIHPVSYLTVVDELIELNIVLPFVLAYSDLFGSQIIAKLNGSLQLRKTVALFGQQLRLTSERLNKTKSAQTYLILDISLFGAALISTSTIKG
jgi:hypothetical protein